jgi:hypothetical protein
MRRMQRIRRIVPCADNLPLQEQKQLSLCLHEEGLSHWSNPPNPFNPPHPVEPLNLDARLSLPFHEAYLDTA